MLRYFLVLSIFILCHRELTHADVFDPPCSRVVFEHPSTVDGYDFKYTKELTAVFVKTTRVSDDFPVYKSDRDDIYFSYHKASKKFYFSKANTSIGLAVEANSTYLENPSLWTAAAMTPLWAPLGHVFTGKFFYRDNGTIKNADVQLTCVALSDCISKPLFFTDYQFGETGTFHIVPNLYQDNRPVYKRSNDDYYLFHHLSGHWLIGLDTKQSRGRYAARSNAVKPELVQEQWEAVKLKEWVFIRGTLTCSVTRPTEQTTTETFTTIDDKPGLLIGIVALVVLVPLLLPCLHFCCYNAYRKSKNKDRTSCSSIISVHAYFGMFIWLVYCVCFFLVIDREATGKFTVAVILAIAFVFILAGYVYVWVESFFSSTMKYLKTSRGAENASGFIHSLIAAKPTIGTKMGCYHMEKRTRKVRYRDSRGNTEYRAEEYEVKVITWTGYDPFVFEFWKDVSDTTAIPQGLPGQILRVKMTQEVQFADEATKQRFLAQQVLFVLGNQHRDKLYETNIAGCIPNFKDHVIMYDTNRGQPCWMNNYCFMLSTCLCCSWPFRWFMRASTKKKHFDIKKKISVNPLFTAVDLTAFALKRPLGPSLGPPVNDHDEIIQMDAVPSQKGQVNPSFQETPSVPVINTISTTGTPVDYHGPVLTPGHPNNIRYYHNTDNIIDYHGDYLGDPPKEQQS